MATQKTEEWKDILGYEGIYSVSNFGKIKSLSRYCYGIKNRKIKERILKDRYSFGYKRVILSKNGEEKAFSVHRLVSEAFIIKSKNNLVVNHKDGNRSNNFVDNLEWVTQSNNVKHGFDVLGRKPSQLGKFGGKHGASKKVIQMDLLGNVIKIWDSRTDVLRYGIKAWNMSHCFSGKVQTSGGFKWKLLN